jgi:hypothetical protein
MLILYRRFQPDSDDGPSNSVGILSLVVANLPPEIR